MFSEEKQKSTLSEWHSVTEKNTKSETDTPRQRSAGSITKDYDDLLDYGGDPLFNQLVSFFVFLFLFYS